MKVSLGPGCRVEAGNAFDDCDALSEAAAAKGFGHAWTWLRSEEHTV